LRNVNRISYPSLKGRRAIKMTNTKRLEKLREEKGELDIGTSIREDRMEEITLIIAEELCKTNEILQRKFNIYHIGGD